MCLQFLGEYCENGVKYTQQMIENLPCRPLFFSPGSKCLEPDSKCSDFIGAMSAFNCIYPGHYFSDRAEICQE